MTIKARGGKHASCLRCTTTLLRSALSFVDNISGSAAMIAVSTPLAPSPLLSVAILFIPKSHRLSLHFSPFSFVSCACARACVCVAAHPAHSISVASSVNLHSTPPPPPFSSLLLASLPFRINIFFFVSFSLHRVTVFKTPWYAVLHALRVCACVLHWRVMTLRLFYVFPFFPVFPCFSLSLLFDRPPLAPRLPFAAPRSLHAFSSSSCPFSSPFLFRSGVQHSFTSALPHGPVRGSRGVVRSSGRHAVQPSADPVI